MDSIPLPFQLVSPGLWRCSRTAPFPSLCLGSTSAWACPHLALETSQGWEGGVQGWGQCFISGGKGEKRRKAGETPLLGVGGGPCPDLLSDPVPSVRSASPSPPWLQALGPSSLASLLFLWNMGPLALLWVCREPLLAAVSPENLLETHIL